MKTQGYARKDAVVRSIVLKESDNFLLLLEMEEKTFEVWVQRKYARDWFVGQLVTVTIEGMVV